MTNDEVPCSGWSFTVQGEEDEPTELDDITVAHLKQLGTRMGLAEGAEIVSGNDSSTFITIEAPDGVPEEDLQAVAAGMIAAIEAAVADNHLSQKG